ncbi:MAG: glutathione peroxidase [Gammaproteobacteria bacterium]|jgi:glutathione peroxidase
MRQLFITVTLLFSHVAYVAADCPDYLNVDLEVLRSKKTVNICEDFANKPLLIVNTASQCGYTPQFEGLEKLHQTYKDQGLVVLGFPSNSFKQELDNKEEIAKVCYVNYGVTFQMLSDTSVKGDDAHPVFKELARQSNPPSWNFNKYLVDKNGKVVEHFGSKTKPNSRKMHDSIKKVL